MTKQVQTYYLFDELSRTIFHTNNEAKAEERTDLIFLGSSMNPNIRMTASVMVQKLDQNFGYTLKQLDGSLN